MPADNGSGCHLDERFLPSSPAPSQYDPEQLVCRSESPARALGVKSEQLLTQGKIFEDDILAGPECTNNPAEEVPEPYDHAQNLTGTLPIELGAKSLILRVYDVLMNDMLPEEWNSYTACTGLTLPFLVPGVWLSLSPAQTCSRFNVRLRDKWNWPMRFAVILSWLAWPDRMAEFRCSVLPRKAHLARSPWCHPARRSIASS